MGNLRQEKLDRMSQEARTQTGEGKRTVGNRAAAEARVQGARKPPGGGAGAAPPGIGLPYSLKVYC